jgi:Rieske Fe-S protein
MTESTEPRLDRRRLLGGVALLGVAAPVLAACGSEDDPETSSTPSGSDSSTSPSEDASSDPSAGTEGELVAAADVPVGGGVVIDAEKVVVTQPADGDFKCFTAVCTHQGCLVQSVEDNTITCPCHGSQYSAEDGSVVNGPATAALSEIGIQVKGGAVVRT